MSAEPDEVSTLWVRVLTAATIVAVVATCGAAIRLAHRRRPDGTWDRAFTLGAKLSLTTGGLASLLLGMASFSMWSANIVGAANERVVNTDDKQLLMAHLGQKVLEERMAHRLFRMEKSDKSLKQFSDASASAEALVAVAERAVHEPELASEVEKLAQANHGYIASVRDVVRLTDERETIASTQARLAADRALALMQDAQGLYQKTAAESDGQAATRMADAAGDLTLSIVRFQSARVGLFKYLAATDQATAKQIINDAETAQKILRKRGAEPLDERAGPAIKEAIAAIEFWQNRLERVFQASAERDAKVKENSAFGDIVTGSVATLIADYDGRSNAAVAAEHQAESRMGVVSITIATIATVLATAVAAVLTRSITRGAARVVKTLTAVAQGDLRQPPLNEHRSDELGELARATDAMATSLRGIIQEVSSSSMEVSTAATEIAASAEEMSASVSEVAQQATRASQTAGSAGDMATEGGKVVAETVERISEINHAVAESAASVRELGQRGEQIGAVIAVINDIADQTNLLALNAAIEAARAGEHGRGFAVVADEVRKLADRTTKATEEIGGSIKAIQLETTNAVDRMDRGAERVQGGVESAQRAGASLEKIVSGAREVAGMIQAITAASEEAGAGASQSASAAAQLSTKSEQLRSLVSKFKI